MLRKVNNNDIRLLGSGTYSSYYRNSTDVVIGYINVPRFSLTDDNTSPIFELKGFIERRIVTTFASNNIKMWWTNNTPSLGQTFSSEWTQIAYYNFPGGAAQSVPRHCYISRKVFVNQLSFAVFPNTNTYYVMGLPTPTLSLNSDNSILTTHSYEELELNVGTSSGYFILTTDANSFLGSSQDIRARGFTINKRTSKFNGISDEKDIFGQYAAGGLSYYTRVTGTTSETKTSSILIPGGTFTVGDIVVVDALFSKSTVSNASLFFSYNTSDTLTGATDISYTLMTASSIYYNKERHYYIRNASGVGSGVEYGTEGSSGINTIDDGLGTYRGATYSINWNNNLYILSSVQLSNDSETCDLHYIRVYKL